jgi:hypothetical protein
MIGYYIHAGDDESANMFIPYIWGVAGLGIRIRNHLDISNLGTDLDLILIKYYLEGKFSSYLPIEPNLGNYLKKNKDIGLDIGVTKEAFHLREEFERREFIVDSTMKAVSLVHNRLSKKKLDINFNLLMEQLNIITHEYLGTHGKYYVYKYNEPI